MKISLFFELPLPRPWDEGSEYRLYHESLDILEKADQMGFHCAWATEHHFLEEYSHSSAPEIFFAAAARRTERIRFGHGIVHMPPTINHPARVAERIAALDIVSNGRVEFGTGESSSEGELGGFRLDPDEKRGQWEEGLRVAKRCMTESPFTGFSGKYVSMPQRNVVPKPLQKPHPPVWVACTRHATVQMAAERGLGALSFSFVSPEDIGERVKEYYEIFEDRGAAMMDAVNPNIVGIGGEMSLMCAPTEEQAVARLNDHGGWFGFGNFYYYKFGDHYPGKSNLEEAYKAEIAEDPTKAYGPDRGPVGTPDQIREWCRRYEASGIDEVMFLLNPNSYETTMESLDLMGKHVLPEFIERDEKASAEKAQRLAPAIERAMARKEEYSMPYDPDYSFGGVPTGSSGKQADEALIALQEMTDAQAREAMRRAGRG